MRRLLPLLFLAGCTPAVVLPPLEFDHAPTREFLDVRMPYWAINNACRTFGELPPGRVEGCVVPGRPALRIVPSDGVDAPKLAAIIRHENGHLNGWPADHKGGRF